MKLTSLEQTFLDIVAIDEVHPHEREVLAYIKRRLNEAGVSHRQDAAGNVVARIPGGPGAMVALVGHTDIAAPLAGRQVEVTANRIKTDGTGLLGGDDKTAVAAMLELASNHRKPARPVELIFTVGEEAGCIGAAALDMSLMASKQAIVFDWTGRVNRVITKSPAYVKINIEYTGLAAHPAHWQDGKNAGAALIEAASRLKTGEYAPGVTCNIGIFGFGKARNQVPGQASLQAELRSHDTAALDTAITEVKALFAGVAKDRGINATLDFIKDSPAYVLDETGDLYRHVKQALAAVNLQPQPEPTFGGFDANILASRGIETVILGAAYHDPHSVAEYVDRTEFAELGAFIRSLAV